MKVKIYFDGACLNIKDNRESLTGCGVAVYIDEEYSEYFSKAFAGDPGTSNLAEWCACVEAMKIGYEISELAKQLNEQCKIVVLSDSQVITRQFNGVYQIKENSFWSYFRDAKYFANKMEKNLHEGSIHWVPREQNVKADILSKQGLTEARRLGSRTEQIV